ncbi:hypothetical protein KY289_007616 [Solanum tuberosum]|nr:hypothetical protein KY289_007616 [Solanum tuberosum]
MAGSFFISVHSLKNTEYPTFSLLPTHLNTMPLSSVVIVMLPTRTLDGDSPYFRLYGTLANYNKLRVFGCLCYPWLRPYNQNKLQPRSTPCIFLGYSQNQSAYKCYDPVNSRLYLSHHVDFVEHSFPYMSLEPTESRPQNDTVDSWVPNHFVIPLTRDQPSSITSLTTSTTPHLGPISSSGAPDNASSSNGNGNSSSQHSGMSLSHSSSSMSSTSSEPSLLDNINESDQNSTIQPSHPMTTRSKNNIHKPVQKLCLSATVHDSANLTVSHVSPLTKPS